MKTLFLKLLSTLALFICITADAQDVITLKTGQELNAKVLKVGTTEIEYKRSDNLEGPSYTIQKKELYAIKYQNGTIDMFSAPRNFEKEREDSTRAAQEEAAENKRLLQEKYETSVKRSKQAIRNGIICTSVGVPCIVGGGYLLAVGLPLAHKHYDTPIPRYNLKYMGIVVSGWALLAGGIVSTVIGPIEIRRGIDYKRWANNTKPNLSFIPSIEPANAIYGPQTGLAMRITF